MGPFVSASYEAADIYTWSAVVLFRYAPVPPAAIRCGWHTSPDVVNAPVGVAGKSAASFVKPVPSYATP